MIWEFNNGDCVSVIGCGGKTSTINCIANSQPSDLSILITPTTKIGIPQGSDCVLTDEASALSHTPILGTQYAGILDGEKLKALPDHILAEITGKYDLTLMEADGSRRLPMKGWAEYEPVVPGFTSKTLCIIQINALGKPATEEYVHRLPEFLTITGAKYGDVVDENTLAKMAFAMISYAKGDIWLIVNGVNKKEKASNFLHIFRNNCGGENVKLIAGNSHTDIWYEHED